ncbi:MAG: VOC family protein [Bacteroidales bacterium]|nr:VOC family protein [Bacteroidales bacterium]MDT8430576.1 VOC family protein [Bacteroidales bacterium]
MDVNFHSSVVFCNDLPKQREFYEKFLGQKVKQDLGGCIVFQNGFTLWQLEEKYPISRELGYTYEPIGNRNLELCFETEAIEDSVEKVLLSDLRILHNLEEEEWGQYTIRFYDPEGNLVEIGESLRTMVKRMQQSGLGIDEIAKKSGLHKRMVENLLEINL